MKKLVIISIVTAMLLASGAALAQPSASGGHGMSVTVPSLLMLRLTPSNNVNAVATPSDVVFSWLAGDFEPVGTFSPTNLAAANWGTVRVFANGGGWIVRVSTDTTEGFDWSKVRVTPIEVDGTTVAAFNLPVGGGEDSALTVASGTSNTNGWRNLGFGPAQYQLTLDGSELPNTYTTTVTYTVANP